MILFTLLFLLLGVLVGLLLRLQRRSLLPDSRQQVRSGVREILEQMESQYQLRLLTSDLWRETQPPRIPFHPPPA